MSAVHAVNKNFNSIPENVPVIFLERPWTVFKLSFKENIRHWQRFKLLLRAIGSLFKAIVTWDLNAHAGLFIKENGKIYRYHMTLSKAIKQEASQHFLMGCQWLIPIDQQILNRHKSVQPASTKNIQDLYHTICESVREACKQNIGYVKRGKSSLLFSRKRNINKDYLTQYRSFKLPTPAVPKRPGRRAILPTYTCTELVALAYIREGIQIAPSRYKIGKILMSDLVEYNQQHGLFIHVK